MENLRHKGFPTCSPEQVTTLMEIKFDDKNSENYWLSFRNNANNSWYVNSNGNFNNNNSYNLNVIIPVMDLCIKLLDAEEVCWKNKHSSVEAALYHFNLARIVELANTLSNNKYLPSTTKCFVIAYPVWREIFAALYLDRIVHHLVAPFINEIAEYVHIKNGNISHGNRKKHSALYAAERIRLDVKELTNNYTTPCYVSTNDFSGFFMSIDRQKAFDTFVEYQKLVDLPNYSNTYRSFLINLCRILILHDPTLDYLKISPDSSWDKVPHRKSMFYSEKGHGLPIGNFYSQLIANLFLGKVDTYLHNNPNIKVERFVDDIFIGSQSKDELLLVRKNLIILAQQFGLKISENKFYILPFYHGVKFCGRIIKNNRIYFINRTIKACSNKIKYNKTKPQQLKLSINSYFGLFSKANEFKTLKLITNLCLKLKLPLYFYRRNRNQLICKTYNNVNRKIY